jgi:hypothetical protein
MNMPDERIIETPAILYTKRRYAFLAAVTLLAGCAVDTHSGPDTLPPLGPTSVPAAPTTGQPAAVAEATTLPAVTSLAAETSIVDTEAPAETAPPDTVPAAPTGTSPVAHSNLVGSGVSTGDHDTNGEHFERFVLRFNGEPDVETGLPGWQAGYVDAPVKMKGKAFLKLTVGAWMYQEGGGNGPQRITDPNLELIQEEALTENKVVAGNKGEMSWTLGLDKTRSYTVKPLSGTEKCPVLCIVIDVMDDPQPAQP